MKLIIVEKPTVQTIILKYLANEDKFEDFKVYSLYDDVFSIKEKATGRPFLTTHQHHCCGALNTSDKYFPFNCDKFSYKIHNKTNYQNLKKLIDDASEIINLCDPSRSGILKFESIIYSGLFNLKNKQIVGAGLYSYLEKDIQFALNNLTEEKLYANQIVNSSTVSKWGLEIEIAADLNKQGLLNNINYTALDDKISQKYEKKYNINMSKMNLFNVIRDEDRNYFIDILSKPENMLGSKYL